MHAFVKDGRVYLWFPSPNPEDYEMYEESGVSEEIRAISSPEVAGLVVRAYHRCIASAMNKLSYAWGTLQQEPGGSTYTLMLEVAKEDALQSLREADVLFNFLTRYIVRGVEAPFVERIYLEDNKKLARTIERILTLP